MKRDIKYIIKRILIGAGIALLLGFINQNVYAFEWTTTEDEYIYTSNNVGLSYSYLSFYSSRSPSYPYSQTSLLNGTNFNNNILSCSSTTISDVNYCIGMAGDENGATSSFYGPYNFLGFEYTFTNTTLPAGNYYIILSGAYNNILNANYVTDFEYNEDLLLDSSTYSVNTNNINIKSVLFSSNVDNTIIYGNYWDKIFYFKIYFEVLEEVSNFKFTIGDLSTQTGVLSSFNNSTFENYLYRYNFAAMNVYNRYSYIFMYPMIYSHTPGDIFPDFSTMVEDQLSEIDDEITSGIQNGEYTIQNDLDAFSGGGGGAGIAFGNNNISDILTIPLQFLQRFNSDTTCEPLTIPLPKLNTNMSLPCMSTFFQGMFGAELFAIIQLILGVGVAFKVSMAFYYTILNILDPQRLITN